MKTNKVSHEPLLEEIEKLQKKVAVLQRSKTQLRKVKEELKRERDFSTAVLDVIDALVLVLDKKGCVIGFNRACEKISGYSFEEVNGKCVWDLGMILPESKPTKTFYQKLFKGDFHHRGESILFTKASGQRIIQWSNRPLLDDKGSVIYNITTGIDVTEHKSAECRLSKALEQTKKRGMETTELLRSTHVILKSSRLESDIKKIVLSCKKITDSSLGLFVLVGGDNSRKILYSDILNDPHLIDLVFFHYNKNFLKEPCSKLKTLFYNNSPQSGSSDPLPDIRTNIKNILIMPILIGQETVGVLFLANKPKGFNQGDVRLVSAFGELIAIALRNSRMLALIERSQDSFRALAESSSDAIVISDSEKIIFCNKSAANMYGFKLQELYGKSPYILIPERYRDINKESVQKINKQGLYTLKKPMEVYNLKKDGTEFPVEYSTSIWKSDGKIYLSSIIRDITERKQAEDVLRKSEEKLSGIINSITDCMVMVDDGFTILWVNEVVRKCFGSGIVEKKCFSVFCNLCKPCDSCIAKRCFHDGDSYDHEKKFFVDNHIQRDYWCTANVAARDDKGKPKIVILVFRDITERNKLMAEALRASHLASLGELSAGVAHEINNPINGIISLAEILLDTFAKNSKEFGVSNRIIQEGERVSTIVKSLLSFAREDSNDKTRTSVKPLLIDSLNLTEAQLRRDAIAFELEIGEDFPHVLANPHQLQQVFLNIINNARYALNQKHSSGNEKKSLKVVCSKVTEKSVLYIRTMFVDNGIGVPLSILEKIINPFYTTKPKGEGTGLGLSISHGIIKEHGGSLRIDSLGGKYCKVIIDIPAIRPNTKEIK